jgi:hypothetical protein
MLHKYNPITNSTLFFICHLLFEPVARRPGKFSDLQDGATVKTVIPPEPGLQILFRLCWNQRVQPHWMYDPDIPIDVIATSLFHSRRFGAEKGKLRRGKNAAGHNIEAGCTRWDV